LSYALWKARESEKALKEAGCKLSVAMVGVVAPIIVAGGSVAEGAVEEAHIGHGTILTLGPNEIAART